ncbi:MAG TPA: SDR family oxidoreductase, partial [Trebonia sp.]|nr:SDR family oxidoreductase [Trebonia sp.]
DTEMTGLLKDKTVLVVGRGGGLAQAVVLAARDEGAALAAAYQGEPGVRTEHADLSDEASIAALGERLGSLDHLVSTASARARGRIGDPIAVAITNAAADTLTRSLALELAPVRVNAISPGVIDTGAWDALGEQGKADYFADIAARNPVRRIGTAGDIAQAVMFALTNSFLTGQTLHVDGGEPLT